LRIRSVSLTEFDQLFCDPWSTYFANFCGNLSVTFLSYPANRQTDKHVSKHNPRPTFGGGDYNQLCDTEILCRRINRSLVRIRFGGQAIIYTDQSIIFACKRVKTSCTHKREIKTGQQETNTDSCPNKTFAHSIETWNSVYRLFSIQGAPPPKKNGTIFVRLNFTKY